MAELRETCINWVYGENYYYISTSILKDINHVKKQKEKYPDLVEIRHINSDGSLVAKLSKKLRPPVSRSPKKGREYTEEEKQANGERLRQYHKKKKKENLDGQS